MSFSSSAAAEVDCDAASPPPYGAAVARDEEGATRILTNEVEWSSWCAEPGRPARGSESV